MERPQAWGQLVPLLARHHKVITYDRRGYGASERPPGPRRIREDDVEDLAGLIARVADGPADLVGSSLGAAIALRLAALHSSSPVRSAPTSRRCSRCSTGPRGPTGTP